MIFSVCKAVVGLCYKYVYLMSSAIIFSKGESSLCLFLFIVELHVSGIDVYKPSCRSSLLCDKLTLW